jgi:hypothetical protein
LVGLGNGVGVGDGVSIGVTGGIGDAGTPGVGVGVGAASIDPVSEYPATISPEIKNMLNAAVSKDFLNISNLPGLKTAISCERTEMEFNCHYKEVPQSLCHRVLLGFIVRLYPRNTNYRTKHTQLFAQNLKLSNLNFNPGPGTLGLGTFIWRNYALQQTKYQRGPH